MSGCSSGAMNASAWPTVGQQDVAAGLVRLGLDGEPQVVALLHDVAGDGVDALAVAVERSRTSLAASYSAPSRPPHMTNVLAPSSAARSMLRITLRRAKRRTPRSLVVKPPSLKTGCVNRLVVTIATMMPVSARAFLNRSRTLSRVALSEPKGTRSSSWKVTATPRARRGGGPTRPGPAPGGWRRRTGRGPASRRSTDRRRTCRRAWACASFGAPRG